MIIENIDKLKDVKKYTCGSPNLNAYLEENGIKSVYSYKLSAAKHNKTMWVFIMTPELSQLLIQWSNNKPNKK